MIITYSEPTQEPTQSWKQIGDSASLLFHPELDSFS